MAGGIQVSRSVLADQVKEQLLDMIVKGVYPPDSRIVETAVAKELNTSQAPVREALRSLEALGIVEIIAFRGARVRGLSGSELIDAYVVRSTLESLAARLAVPRLTDADIDDLAELFDRMLAGAAENDGHAVATSDAAFHSRIVELAGNSVLTRQWRALEPLSRTYLTLALPGADPEWSANLHAPILEALKRRDTDAVVSALEEHFSEASAKLVADLHRANSPDQAAGPNDPHRTAGSPADAGKAVAEAPATPASAGAPQRRATPPAGSRAPRRRVAR